MRKTVGIHRPASASIAARLAAWQRDLPAMRKTVVIHRPASTCLSASRVPPPPIPAA